MNEPSTRARGRQLAKAASAHAARRDVEALRRLVGEARGDPDALAWALLIVTLAHVEHLRAEAVALGDDPELLAERYTAGALAEAT